MATTTETVPLPDVELLETDGEPLETQWHRFAMNLLIEQVQYRMRDRRDFFVGGNMFIYFSLEQARNRDYRGPDFFFVDRVRDQPLRPYWVVWEEGGRYPDVIIELSSHSTADEDHTTKKRIYEQTFRTPDYFIYDPETQTLHGWRLTGGHYQPLSPNDQGRLWSEQLQLWLGGWEGPYVGIVALWLRWFDAEGAVVPLFAEAVQSEADDERIRAQSEQRRADAGWQQADAERQRADAERQRAEAAEQELEQLRAQLAERDKPSA